MDVDGWPDLSDGIHPTSQLSVIIVPWRDQRKRTAPDWFPGPFSRDAMERKGQSGSLLPAPRWCSFTGRSLTNESPDRDEIGGGHA